MPITVAIIKNWPVSEKGIWMYLWINELINTIMITIRKKLMTIRVATKWSIFFKYFIAFLLLKFLSFWIFDACVWDIDKKEVSLPDINPWTNTKPPVKIRYKKKTRVSGSVIYPGMKLLRNGSSVSNGMNWILI